MSVDFDRFLRWVESRFDEVKVSGKEIRVNSIFTDDENQHLWLSPSGGKKKRNFGVYHCFKTDKKGSLTRFIMQVEHCDRDEAINILRGEATVRDLEKQLEEFFASQDQEPPEPPPSPLTLPEGSYLLTDLPDKDWWKKKCVDYLSGRHIPIDGLYICKEKPFKARIIIPYYDEIGRLIYFNGRSLFPESKIRYMGPPKECGVGKGDVVYFPDGKWPAKGTLVHVCEGEFNAKSLKLSELDSAACGGKNMTEKQALMLGRYRICLCLDRDKAGKAGTTVMSNAVSMLSQVIGSNDKLSYVRPPEKFNDWNEMYVAEGAAMVYHYINKFARPIDFNAPAGMVGNWFLWNEL